MGRCIIVTSFLEGKEHLPSPLPADYVIAADGGWKYLDFLGLKADRIIGDFDSSEAPDFPGITLLPRRKDMTDTEAALDLAESEGYTEILVLGGLGGRFDHTLGNVNLLKKTAEKGLSVAFEDGYNRVKLLKPGTYTLEKGRFQYISLIPAGAPAEGVSISGTEYELERAAMPNNTTLGISNEIRGTEAKLCFEKGLLLVVQSNDVNK